MDGAAEPVALFYQQHRQIGFRQRHGRSDARRPASDDKNR
jgi:hypothetical protein